MNTLVLYNPGNHGTWLTFFINEHYKNVESNLKNNGLDYSAPELNYYFDKPFTVTQQQALKIIPHHFLDGYENKLSNVLTKTQSSKIVVPIVNETFVEKVKERARKILPYTYIAFGDNDIKIINEKLQPQTDIKIHTVDIGKLLYSDVNEYKLLVEYLEVQELDNWDEYTKLMVKDFYE